MEKFNKIIADGKEFESFATPSELQELKENLLTTLDELKENLTGIVEQGNEGVKINDNNNRDVIVERIGELLNELKDFADVGVVTPITDKVEELLAITNGKIDSNHSLLIAETQEIINKIDDLQTFVVDVLGDKIDALATSQAQGFSEVQDSIIVTQNDIADVAIKVEGVGSKVNEVNGKLDDVLVGKDALRQAISEKIGREASNTLVGMAEDVESLQHLEPMWQNIGYNEAPQGLIEDILYSQSVKEFWEKHEPDKTIFKHTDDVNFVFMPNIDLVRNNTTTFNIGGNLYLRYISEELDLRTITTFSAAKSNSLLKIPNLDLSSCTNMNSAFRETTGIRFIGKLKTPMVPTWDYCFYGCKITHIEELDFTSTTRLNSTFCSTIEYIVIKNLGNKMTSIGLSDVSVWGTGSDENKESLRKTLVELTPTKTTATTVKLSPNTYAVYETFSEEDKQIIEDKGFTITK